ncbi:MAG: AarF/ABC1/UbiB kinase family protein [Acidobacteria bacterium]|nr:AarF/ABC1/UbiB kinase family protein [Acidobacteriota bacterium]
MVAGLRVRHLVRYAEIGRLLARYGHSDLARDVGFSEIDSGQGEDGAPDAERLADDLERLGPTFIKVGQLLSTRTDLLPKAYTDALSRLQDDVAPMPFGDVAHVIEDELGLPVHDAYAWLDESPLASASLGQVHRARLANGRDVVVKVQRPGVREQVADDMAAITELAELLDEHTDLGRRIGFAELAEQFTRSLAGELDYRREADNLVRLAEIVAPYRRLVVPRPVRELTTGRVLTMDDIPGRKITEIGPVARVDLDGAVLADQLFRAYLDQVLAAGFFHADPHPGNVLLTAEGDLALIDLGMTARVSPALRDGLVKILLAIGGGHGEQAADVAVRIGRPLDDFDHEGFVRRAAALIDRADGSVIAEIDVGSLVMEVCATAATHGLRLPAELSLLGKALLNLDQVTRCLAPDFDPSETMRSHLADVLSSRVPPSRDRLYAAALETRELLEQMPGRLNRLFETASKGEFHIRVDAFDERELLHGLRQVANRITMGLLLAALVVGSAMLSRGHGTSGPATIGFVVAATGSLVLVLNITLDNRRRHRGR